MLISRFVFVGWVFFFLVLISVIFLWICKKYESCVLSIFLACSAGVFTRNACCCWDELRRKVGEEGICCLLERRLKRKRDITARFQLQIWGRDLGDRIPGVVDWFRSGYYILVSLEGATLGLSVDVCWSWELGYSD